MTARGSIVGEDGIRLVILGDDYHGTRRLSPAGIGDDAHARIASNDLHDGALFDGWRW